MKLLHGMQDDEDDKNYVTPDGRLYDPSVRKNLTTLQTGETPAPLLLRPQKGGVAGIQFWSLMPSNTMPPERNPELSVWGAGG